jgi:hypothetical protein
MFNTDKLIAALTDATEARKAALRDLSENARYEASRDEVEHELKLFIAHVIAQQK